MRWITNPLIGREGEERVVQKFLLYPRTFNNETRWLENAAILERVIKVDVGGSMEWGNYAEKWREVGFADQSSKCKKRNQR